MIHGVLALATVSGPLPKLGVVIVSLLVAGVLLARRAAAGARSPRSGR